MERIWNQIFPPYWNCGCTMIPYINKNENIMKDDFIKLNDGTSVSSGSYEYLLKWVINDDYKYIQKHFLHPHKTGQAPSLAALTGREFSRLWTFAISKEEFKVPPPPKESTVEKHMLESKLAFINHLSDPAIEILQYSIGVERMDVTTIMDSYRNLKLTGIQEITLTIKDNRK